MNFVHKLLNIFLDEFVRNNLLTIFHDSYRQGGTIGILLAYERPSLFTNTGVILMSPAIKTNPQVVTPFKVG